MSLFRARAHKMLGISWVIGVSFMILKCPFWIHQSLCWWEDLLYPLCSLNIKYLGEDTVWETRKYIKLYNKLLNTEIWWVSELPGWYICPNSKIKVPELQTLPDLTLWSSLFHCSSVYFMYLYVSFIINW